VTLDAPAINPAMPEPVAVSWVVKTAEAMSSSMYLSQLLAASAVCEAVFTPLPPAVVAVTEAWNTPVNVDEAIPLLSTPGDVALQRNII